MTILLNPESCVVVYIYSIAIIENADENNADIVW